MLEHLSFMGTPSTLRTLLHTPCAGSNSDSTPAQTQSLFAVLLSMLEIVRVCVLGRLVLYASLQ